MKTQQRTENAQDEPVDVVTRSGRAEALTWPIGAAFLGLLVVTFAVGVWWMSRCAAEQARLDAVTRADALANNLSATVEPLLAAGELSAVRRLLSESALHNTFDVCQLTLSDGATLADADLTRPQMTVMPASWPEVEEPEPDTRVVANRVHLSRPVPIPGQGGATLMIEMPLPNANAALGPALPGVGAIGATGLIGMLLLYRKLRCRLGVLTMIRGALCDAEQGVELDALRLDPRWSHEAEGWNRILEQRIAEEESLLDQQLERLGQRTGSGGALEAGCDGLWQGIAVFDALGKLAYANGAGCAAMGWDREACAGQSLETLGLAPEVCEAVENAYSGTGPARVAIEQDQGEGSDNVLRYNIRPVGSGETAGALMVIEDITQQKVAEGARHDFVAQATHELRTPLTNIRMYLEQAQEDGADDPVLMGECLNVIGRESQRLERLVSEMLSVSEIEAGAIELKRDDIRLDALFQQIESDYSANAKEKQIELAFDLPPKLPVVRGDRDKLAVVLQNLLGNAIKYTPEGGEVRVHVEVTGTQLTVDVTDTGIGISEEDQARVFEKFTRANDPRIGDITGSGLGLALAREITRLHGGELSVESVLNEGSTFKAVLPIKVDGV
ncbi:MAG: ATP-binding protein [Phycisphaerales bacterium JB063]